MDNKSRLLQIAWKHHPGATTGTMLQSMDSLELGSFIISVEEEFDIDLMDEALQEARTVGDILILIEDAQIG